MVALIVRQRAGDRMVSQRAAVAVLLLAAAVLAGCSSLAATTEEAPTMSGLDPSYRDVIANRLKSTFKNVATDDSFEISEPRQVHSLKGWTWLTCVRFNDHGHRRIYAFFMDASAVVDDRYAVQTDDCDRQAYAVFERMGGMTLDPLH
jgi:hypothetical protein